MQIKVIYNDNTTEIVPITLLDQAKAEEFATEAGWGNAQQSPIRFLSYATYWHLRHTGKITDNYEQWIEKVSYADAVREDPKATPANGNLTVPAI